MSSYPVVGLKAVGVPCVGKGEVPVWSNDVSSELNDSQ